MVTKVQKHILPSEQTLVTGKLTEIYPGVHRLLAPNPGPFTGPGTNTYAVGRENIALIDPGPANQSHVDTLVAELGSRVRWLLCTHTHLDHSPGVKLVLEKLDHTVEVIGMPAPTGIGQDQTFLPTLPVKHGDLLQTEEFTLEAIHTPGHASNHLCFLYREAGMLFTGDHIMQGSSVIISPPDGDMKAYMDAVDNLKQYPLEYLAPAHGHIMVSPQQVLEFTLEHRLLREVKVSNAMAQVKQATLDELLPVVYDDVPRFMHPAARQSLWAHLLKFQQENKVSVEHETWVWLSDNL